MKQRKNGTGRFKALILMIMLLVNVIGVMPVSAVAAKTSKVKSVKLNHTNYTLKKGRKRKRDDNRLCDGWQWKKSKDRRYCFCFKK